VQDLSGGFRRRVQGREVFMVDTPVLFLDEFSTGMDPILKRQVMNLLRAESRKGRTIILTTQVLSEAEGFAMTSSSSTGENRSARGDLNTLKQLSRAYTDITLAFDRLPNTIQAGDWLRSHPSVSRRGKPPLSSTLKIEESGGHGRCQRHSRQPPCSACRSPRRKS